LILLEKFSWRIENTPKKLAAEIGVSAAAVRFVGIGGKRSRRIRDAVQMTPPASLEAQWIADQRRAISAFGVGFASA
jgi:hypothetical protein